MPYAVPAGDRLRHRGERAGGLGVGAPGQQQGQRQVVVEGVHDVGQRPQRRLVGPVQVLQHDEGGGRSRPTQSGAHGVGHEERPLLGPGVGAGVGSVARRRLPRRGRRRCRPARCRSRPRRPEAPGARSDSTLRHGHNGGAPSSLAQRPTATVMPRSRAALIADAASQLLPIPGSPTTWATDRRPPAAAAGGRRAVRSSSSRPTETVGGADGRRRGSEPRGCASPGRPRGPVAGRARRRARGSTRWSASPCCRTVASTERISAPGSRPSSSASRARTRRTASRASAWRPVRASASAWSAHSRSRRSCWAVAGSVTASTLAGSPRASRPEQPRLLGRHPQLGQRGPLGGDRSGASGRSA